MAAMTLQDATNILAVSPSLSIHALPNTIPHSQSPTDLIAELAHNRDLFSKLRFSYTEQVTKESFLKAVAADPPELVDPDELAALERKLVADKAGLKAKKGEVADLLGELEGRSRAVAEKMVETERRAAEVVDAVEDAEGLKARKVELLGLRRGRSENELLNLGLDETRVELDRRRLEGRELEERIREVQRAVELRRGDVERLKRDLDGVEIRKRETVKEAMEMRRRRGSGVDVVMDDIEARGRWAKAGVELLSIIA